MTITSTDRKLAGTIFSALNRALKAEGFSDSEAFRFADRGGLRRVNPLPRTKLVDNGTAIDHDPDVSCAARDRRP